MSKFYVSGPEIQDYIVKTTDKYGLRDKITFNTKLLQAAWDEGDGKWKLTLEQGGSLIEDVADIVVDGSGILKYATITSGRHVRDLLGTVNGNGPMSRD